MCKRDTGYSSNKDWVSWDGFDYTDTWKEEDLLPIKEAEEKKGCSQNISVGGGLAAFALLGAACVLTTVRRKKNEK